MNRTSSLLGWAALLFGASVCHAQEKTAPKIGRPAPLNLRGLEFAKKKLARDLITAEKRRGMESNDDAINLNNSALLCQRLGDYATAEKLLRQALDFYGRQQKAQRLGACRRLAEPRAPPSRDRRLPQRGSRLPASPPVAGGLGRAPGRPAAGGMLERPRGPARGDGRLHPGRAVLPRRAAQVKKSSGVKGAAYANSLHNLGLLYERQGKYARAEPLLTRSAKITREALGEKHPSYAHSLESLAFLYKQQGEFKKAEGLYQEALAVYKTKRGEEHPACARTLNNLGALHLANGELDKARPLLERALEIRKKLFGQDHLDTVDSMGDLAALYDAAGDVRKAEALLENALEALNAKLDLTATAQSERQQLAMAQAFRSFLDSYLSVASRAKPDAARLYNRVLVWKGAVFARQQCIRAARDNPKLAPLFAELRDVTSQLAALELVSPDPVERAAWLKQVEELGDRKEAVEKKLAPARGDEPRFQLQAPTAKQIGKSLPAGCAWSIFWSIPIDPPNRESARGQGAWPPSSSVRVGRWCTSTWGRWRRFGGGSGRARQCEIASGQGRERAGGPVAEAGVATAGGALEGGQGRSGLAGRCAGLAAVRRLAGRKARLVSD